MDPQAKKLIKKVKYQEDDSVIMDELGDFKDGMGEKLESIESDASHIVPKQESPKIKIVGLDIELSGIDASGIRGPKGEPGDRGEKGENGKDGVTPVKGKDYFVPREVEYVIREAAELAKPIKGKDYFDGESGPIGPKGEKGPEGKRGSVGLNGLDGKAGKDGIDGKSPEPKEIIEEIKKLKGNDRLDISHIRNGEILASAAAKIGGMKLSDQLWHGGGGDIIVKDDGVQITPKVSSFDFTGGSVVATSDASGNVTVAVSAGIGGPFITVGFSDADYIVDGIDDNVQIQQAVDFVDAAGGGTILIKQGTYQISDTINLCSNLNFIGVGENATILYTEGIFTKMLLLTKLSFVTIENMTLYGNPVAAVNGGAILTTYSGVDPDDMANWCKNITLRNLHIKSNGILIQNWHFGFQFHYIQYGLAENCFIEGVDYSVELERAQDISITNCSVAAMTYGILGSTGTFKRFTATGNHIYPYDLASGFSQGFRLESAHDVVLVGNTIEGATGYGAIVMGTQSAVERVIIEGNTIFNCKRMVEISECSKVIISKNTQGDDSSGRASYGINLLSDVGLGDFCVDVIISGNFIKGGVENGGVDVGEGNRNILIDGNYFEMIDDVADAGIPSAVSLNADDILNVSIINNQFRGVLKEGNNSHGVVTLSGIGLKQITVSNNYAEYCDGNAGRTAYFIYQRFAANTVNDFVVMGNVCAHYVPSSDVDSGLIGGIQMQNIENAILTKNVLNGTITISTSTTNSIIRSTVNREAGTLVNNTLGDFSSTTSAQLRGVISDETGTGSLVFADTPSLITPDIGEATGTSLELTGAAGNVLVVDTNALIVNATNNRVGINVTVPDTTLHVYEDTASTGSTGGLTIEQDGTGDAKLDFLLTGNQRWIVGADNSIADHFAISSSTGLGTADRIVIGTDGMVGIGNGISTPTSILQVRNDTDAASVQVATLEGKRTTHADSDEAYLSLKLKDDGGNQSEFARITWVASDVNIGTNLDGRLYFATMDTNVLTNKLRLDSAMLGPFTNDGLVLGSTSLKWSDLFLASGAVINFNSGDVTLTHSANLLTLAGGDFTVSGALNVTGTTTLAAALTGPLRADSGVVSVDSTLVASTYIPTLTNVANLDGSTAYSCQYMRVGATVTVSGQVDIDPTVALASTQLGISLPVASNLANANECCGTAFASSIAGQGAAILGDAVNNRAQLQYIAGDVTNQAMYFSFTYRII